LAPSAYGETDAVFTDAGATAGLLLDDAIGSADFRLNRIVVDGVPAAGPRKASWG
jgi:hypothetical protein